MTIFKNDKRFPGRYFARHIKEGLVRYTESGKDKFYLLTNEALKAMNKSFEGKPIYIHHTDVDLDKMREQSVGRVVKSFYNEFDGAWWVELIADEPGIEAIEKGWGVSNAYLPTEMKSGGVYHNINYDKEIVNGRYEHLAIVPNPRYEEAVIMTPEEYEEYNESRKQEILKLKNSKENEMEISEEKLAELLTNAADSAVAKFKEVLANEKKENDREDKRRLIREIGALQDKPASDFEGGEDEKWRTITKLAEELAYEKSERSDKDNSKRNESEDKKEDSCEDKKENAEVDKRELIREVMAIASKAGASEEEVRTIAKKLEEIAYNKSEADTKDNGKEEEEKDKEKKENSKFFSMFHNAKANAGEKKTVATMAGGLALGKSRYGSK